MAARITTVLNVCMTPNPPLHTSNLPGLLIAQVDTYLSQTSAIENDVLVIRGEIPVLGHTTGAMDKMHDAIYSGRFPSLSRAIGPGDFD